MPRSPPGHRRPDQPDNWWRGDGHRAAGASKTSDITGDYRRRRRAIAFRSSASRRLASATRCPTPDGRSVSSPSEAATTRNDGPEASGTLAARPRAMNAIKSPAACGVRWKVSTHRSPRQRLTLINPCAGRQVARRPTPRSSTTMWRPGTGGNSWLLLLARVTPQWSRDSGGHARGLLGRRNNGLVHGGVAHAPQRHPPLRSIG